MMSSAVKSLLWKEYREQRALAATAVFGTLGIGLIILMVSAAMDERLENGWTLSIALLGPLVFAIGSGATTFAGEHDNETFDVLRTMPIAPSVVVRTKLLFGLLTSAALILGLAGIAIAIESAVVSSNPSSNLSANRVMLFVLPLVFALTAWEVYAWGALWSLIVARPLWAVVLAIISEILMLGTILITLASLTNVFNSDVTPRFEMAFWFVRPAAALLLTLACLSLGKRWFNETMFGSRGRAAGRAGVDDVSAAVSGRAGGLAWAALRAARRPWQRLLWQEWRQAALLVLALYVATGAVVAMTSWLAALSPSPGSVDSGRNMPLRLAVIATTLLGACTFSGDQWRSRFRFFAERGVSARMVWLARLTFWSVAALVWCGIVWQFATAQATHVPATPTLASASGQPAAGAVAGVFVAPGVQPQFAEWLAAHAGPTVAEAMIGLALIGFVVGQWTSMRIRSPIAAVFAAGILATLAVLWSMWMARLRVPLWLSVAPLAPILLFSSWLTAPDWLLEREGRRVWKRDALTLYLPLLAMLLSFAAYRAWEIPAHLMPGDPAVSVLNWGPRGNESAPTTLSGADTARLRSEMRTAIDEVLKPHEQLLSGDAGAWGGRPFVHRMSLFLMPWETARSKRLIEREREILTKRVDQAIARLCVSVPLHTERDNFDPLDNRVLDVFTQQYRETTRFFDVSPAAYSNLAARLGRAESIRRLARAKHALEAYRKQHGEWPDRFEQLVPEHLPAVPVDPYTGLPMLYVRGGLSRTLTLPSRPELTQVGDEARELGFDRENVELPAGEPFLWLAGEKVVASPLHGQGGPALQSYWFMRTTNRYDDRMHMTFNSIEEMLQAGWIVPLELK